MIDSHCHLAGEEFVDDLDQVVTRAREAGLVRCLVILAADDPRELERANAVAEAWPDVRFAIGVHPHNAHRFSANPDQAVRLVEQAFESVPRACAIGEIGLDYHYDFSPVAVQHAVFEAQLRLARERHLPVVIHTREAEDDTLHLIADAAAAGVRGVFHCFSGNSAAATRALTTGFYLSIPGIATFPKSIELRDAVRFIPDDRLLIETDSPYLAPIPFRGKRNEPAHVVRVLELLSDVRGTTPEALGGRLVANFDALFG